MVLKIPDYIQKTKVFDLPADYPWGGGKFSYNKQSPKMGALLLGMSRRAAMAYGIAMAEWVLWRLHTKSDFKPPFQFMEATWAANIDVRYCVIPTVVEYEGMKGKVDRALNLSKELLEKLMRAYDTPSMTNLPGHCVYIYFLAKHVVSCKSAFESWVDATAKRLTELYPFSKSDIAGEPVPREALDPAFNFDKKQSQQLLANFLKDLDPASNPYLRPAGEMKAKGFIGTPYA